jgi:hypothetical protein
MTSVPHQTRLNVPVVDLNSSCSQGERTVRCLCSQQHSLNSAPLTPTDPEALAHLGAALHAPAAAPTATVTPPAAPTATVAAPAAPTPAVAPAAPAAAPAVAPAATARACASERSYGGDALSGRSYGRERGSIQRFGIRMDARLWTPRQPLLATAVRDADRGFCGIDCPREMSLSRGLQEAALISHAGPCGALTVTQRGGWDSWTRGGGGGGESGCGTPAPRPPHRPGEQPGGGSERGTYRRVRRHGHRARQGCGHRRHARHLQQSRPTASGERERVPFRIRIRCAA